MLTVLIAFCATTLVVAVQANSIVRDDVAFHRIYKREVNCDELVEDMRRQEDDIERCCEKVLNFDNVLEEHNSHDNSSSERYSNPYDNSDLDSLRCNAEEKFRNKSLISAGKIDSGAIQTYLQSEVEARNYSEWTSEMISQVVSKCTSIAEYLLAITGPENCTSEAFEFEVCLESESLKNCPNPYWKESQLCSFTKTYIRDCLPPSPTPSPTPSPRPTVITEPMKVDREH